MQRISARYLLKYQVEELFNLLTGNFILVMDDGELVNNARETCYSAFSWEFHRRYPSTPLLMKHHVQKVLNGNRLGSSTHLALLGNAMWSVYDQQLLENPQISNEAELQLRDVLSETVYRLTNKMYNDLTYRLEAYVTSLDILDFIEVLGHPKIKAANEAVQPSQKSIEETRRIITEVLKSDTEIPHNAIAKAVRSDIVSLSQTLQCVGPRGYVTDTDSNNFRHPVLRGYAQGLRSFHDSLIESRSAAKSLMFAKSPLEDAEYFSRRLQLMSQVIQNLYRGDCGTTKYLNWLVRPPRTVDGKFFPSDIHEKQLVGKYYLDETTGKLRMITEGSHHLHGKLIKIRSPMHCAHPDPYGICTTCFGELSLSVPEGTNIGQMCCTSLAQKASQNVLSVKHDDGNTVIDPIILTEFERDYLKVSNDESSYLLSDALRGQEVSMVIQFKDAQNLADVNVVDNVETLSISRIAEVSEIGLICRRSAESEISVSLDVSMGRRKANLTYPMLKHIKAHGWDIDPKGNYVIKLEGWDWNEPILTLPLRHINMADHSKSISILLESSVGQLQERDSFVSPDVALVELFDLVNEKLNVNLAVLEVVLYATMIVSAKNFDYSLPKPWTDNGLGVMELTMAMRSLASLMAYEGQNKAFLSPYSYIYKNRPNHPFDYILMPQEVMSQPQMFKT